MGLWAVSEVHGFFSNRDLPSLGGGGVIAMRAIAHNVLGVSWTAFKTTQKTAAHAWFWVFVSLRLLGVGTVSPNGKISLKLSVYTLTSSIIGTLGR